MFNQIYGVQPRIFMFGVHISDMREAKKGFSNLAVKVESWSISTSRAYLNTFFPFPDPIKHINSDSWSKIDQGLVNKFRNEYSNYLRKFDGFVSCHPLAFSQIYEVFDKPILAINSTRYEIPYSGNVEKSKSLNEFIKSHTRQGLLTILPNNRADQDYLEFYTGVRGRYVPSLCDYIGQKWEGGGVNLVYAKSTQLSRDVASITQDGFIDFRGFLGPKYSWDELMRVNSILVIPYNISTMFMFELAYAGVPVIVPTKQLLTSLREKYSGVLSEVSCFESNMLDVSQLSHDDPNNYKSREFLDWWLRRADFYDVALMPNITTIDSLEELRNCLLPSDRPSMEYQIMDRNSKLHALRNSEFIRFIEAL